MRKRELASMVSALGAIVVSGCSPYALKGRVIAGDISYITIVERDDPRLSEAGIPGVRLAIMSDPLKPNRKSISNNLSDQSGNIELRVDEIGAGFLEYEVALFANREGFKRSEGFFNLPPSGKRVLVVMCPGRDTGPSEFMQEESMDTLMQEYEKFK